MNALDFPLAAENSETSARLASAKINLALHVTGQRADGYHTLDSLAVFTRFGDRVTLALAEEDGFSASGKYATAVPVDDGNLILKARAALRQRFGADATPPVTIALEKNLPVASGVGGGSSDAAATLRALLRVWNLGLDETELARIGLALGADVPMCLAAQPLVARGIGDELEILPDFPSLGLVLVHPGVAVSTAAVFAGLEQRDNEKLPPLPKKIDFHSLRNWLEITRNDLQPVAQKLHPAIGRALSALNRADAGFARMSGSGAMCFGLFETGNVAKRAAASIRSRYPEMFVAATRSLASGVDANDQANG